MRIICEQLLLKVCSEHLLAHFRVFPARIYFLKVNNGNTRKMREICLKLIIKSPDRRHWHIAVVFLSLTMESGNVKTLLQSSAKYIELKKNQVRLPLLKERKIKACPPSNLKLYLNSLGSTIFKIWWPCFFQSTVELLKDFGALT